MNFNIPFKDLSKSEKIQLYVQHTQPALNKKALFSDGSKFYRFPAEPTSKDEITIRFRAGRNNVDTVYLIYCGERVVMNLFKNDELFDYYEITIPPTDKTIEYYFEVVAGKQRCIYNKRGAMLEPQPYYNFKISPNFSTPDWAKGAVFYQIFVDRFYNGDKDNDVLDNEYIYIGEGTTKVEDWDKYPAAMGVREFYGGDLQGVLDKLDYLKDLGVDVIYLNPIFVSPSNHKYDIQDYDYVDPHFGVIKSDKGQVLPEGAKDNKKATKYINRVTNKVNLEASNKLFIKLTEEIHKRGMKVILDGVFNHCGSFNKWLDKECIYEKQEGYEKGAYVDKKSPYHTFFKFFEEDWPYNHKYDGWWGHDTLPKLNYEESPKLYEYILKIAKKWVSPPYNADGWRLDVAADLGHTAEYNHKFWRDFRKAVKEANPDAIILAEHYGDPGAWLEGDQWDTVMNYDAFMEPLTWFLTGVEKHSDEFRGDLLGNHQSFFDAMSHHMSRFHYQSLEVAMNELSNHDHSRFLTRTNRKVGRTHTLGPEAANENVNKGVFKEAVVVQMTWPGAPTLYYGDEAGVCGWTDPDNRRTYPWGKEDKELVSFHKDVIGIHKKSEALMRGSLKFLYGEQNVISYGRFTNEEEVVVILNNDEAEKTIKIPVWEIGIFDNEVLVSLLTTSEEGHSKEKTEYVVEKGFITITMPPISSVILGCKQ
ncbi:MAG: glycoside hydrolase family 13 protein [Lachnospiraceae bacterium]|nr:glycoside hydrolase family 13 protein [Lachnospiraceae bacterium]